MIATALRDQLGSALDLADGTTPLVARPDGAAQASSVLALASRERWRTRIGSTSDAGVQLVVSAARLCSIASHVAADLTATIDAGATHAAIATALAVYGQWLPLDGPPFATIGATIATGRAGPLRLGYGTPRDHVLGAELVTGDGRILQLGGKVMKNVAGYDLVRLVVGSRGSLGLITRVHVRLRVRPVCDETIAVRASEAGPLVALARELRRTELELAALEVLSPTWSPEHDRWTLLARLHGNPTAIASMRDRIASTGRGLDLAAADGDVWTRLATHEAELRDIARIADRVAMLDTTLASASELSAQSAPALAIHAGSGIARVRVPLDLVDRRARLAAAAATATQHGGSVIDTSSPSADTYASLGVAGVKMRAIVATFDPRGILSDANLRHG